MLQDMVNLRFIYSPANTDLFENIWQETVNELEPEVRKLYLYEVKLGLDATMGSVASTFEYEKLRFAIREDVEAIALEGHCAKCKRRPVIQMKIVEYYQSHASITLVLKKCPLCNPPLLSLHLPQLWNIYKGLYKD